MPLQIQMSLLSLPITTLTTETHVRVKYHKNTTEISRTNKIHAIEGDTIKPFIARFVLTLGRFQTNDTY